MFFYKKNKGLLLESAKVFDNYYGTPKKEAESILKSGKNVLLSIDVQGAKKILKKYPDAVTIFIITPSFQILKKRLEARNSESKKSLKVRLNIAKKELLERKKYKYSVINDDLNKACKTLQNIILSEIGNK